MSSNRQKVYKIPPELSHWIEQKLNSLGWSFKKNKQLAKVILEVSTHFQNSDSKTPWDSKDKMAAYLTYFFPLNYIRTLKVIDEALDFNLLDSVEHVVDFGCGPGTGTRAFLDNTNIKKFTGIDETPLLSPYYLSHKKESSIHYKMEPPRKSNTRDLLLASYVFNEMSSLPEWVFHFDKMILIEPSTHQAFPHFLSMRQSLIEKKWSILAPCPHQKQCPLQGSKKDWCHDRVHWEMPDWFADLSKSLPIQNNTMTFSYLIASKNQSSQKSYSRIVGDPLKEKGKTRWLYCEDDNKKYLSFLKRQGEAPEIARGDKITLKKSENKGGEVRFEQTDLTIHSI